MKHPTPSDFVVDVQEGHVSVIFKPSDSYYSFARLSDPEDIARDWSALAVRECETRKNWRHRRLSIGRSRTDGALAGCQGDHKPITVRCNSPVQVVFLVPGICLRLYRYQHGDPDNVIAFAMVCCCASCDNSSGALSKVPNLSPWEPESAKTRPRWWRARSLGPSVFSQQFMRWNPERSESFSQPFRLLNPSHQHPADAIAPKLDFADGKVEPGGGTISGRAG